MVNEIAPQQHVLVQSWVYTHVEVCRDTWVSPQYDNKMKMTCINGIFFYSLHLSNKVNKINFEILMKLLGLYMQALSTNKLRVTDNPNKAVLWKYALP